MLPLKLLALKPLPLAQQVRMLRLALVLHPLHCTSSHPLHLYSICIWLFFLLSPSLSLSLGGFGGKSLNSSGVAIGFVSTLYEHHASCPMVQPGRSSEAPHPIAHLSSSLRCISLSRFRSARPNLDPSDLCPSKPLASIGTCICPVEDPSPALSRQSNKHVPSQTSRLPCLSH